MLVEKAVELDVVVLVGVVLSGTYKCKMFIEENSIQ